MAFLSGCGTLQGAATRSSAVHRRRKLYGTVTCRPVRVNVVAHSGSVEVQSEVETDSALKGSTLRLYNTMSRSKEDFRTREPGVVRFYSCGPTVYDHAHIGNFRAFLTYDIVKRWLLYRGYTVHHVVNLTDVEDKIIRKVREQETDLRSLTDHFINEFFADMETLNIIRADQYPRATDHIYDMVDVVKTLQKRGYAYEREGSVYFSVDAFKPYGKLARLDRRHDCATPRPSGGDGNGDEDVEDADEYDKEDARDFVLWKHYKPTDGDVFWETEFGKGRPGWHLECTCMSMKFLGPTLDIHGGGIDLIFPHHENEIAQSEAASGEAPFAQFWVHNGFVNINGEKMSKSLGNFWTLRDIAKTPDDARAFRYLVATSQYRSTLNMSDEVLKGAKSAVRRIDKLRNNLNAVKDSAAEPTDVVDVIKKVRKDFIKNMDDDLNTPRAAATMFELIGHAEKRLKTASLSGADAVAILECLADFDKVFGIFYEPRIATASAGSQDMADFSELLVERTEARSSKNWARADEIRDIILAAGFIVKDTADGPTLVPKD